MGKKKLNANKRKKLIVGLVLLLAADAVVFLLFGLIGIQVDKEIKTATHKTKSDIEYGVTFLDNPLYNEENLEMGTAYIVRYVDQLNLTFLYDLESSGLGDVSGDYSVVGDLEAEFDSKNLLWKKEYTLIPETGFTSGQAADSCSIKVNDYRDLVKNIEDETDITVAATMTITYTVHVTAQIDGEPVTETSVSTLSFSLDQDVLVFSGEPVNEQEQSVTKTVAQSLIPKKTALDISISLFVVLAAALLCALLLTEGVSPDRFETALKQIAKKYGSRIVELNEERGPAAYETVAVRTFRDLLLTADELKKPIYKNTAENPADTEFHAIDAGRKYIFRVGDTPAVSKPAGRAL